METITDILFILLLLLPGILFYLWIPGRMASKRGRSSLGWIFLTFFTTPVTTILLLLVLGDSDDKIREDILKQSR